MQYIEQLLFLILLAVSVWIFAKNIGQIRKNIMMGKPFTPSGTAKQRLMNMGRVALGQSKMGSRPLAAFLHLFVYAGFILINIEIVEIMIDGLFGTHRFLMPYFGNLYLIAIGFFEILAILVLVACVVFLLRRNVSKVKRFSGNEMKGWPVKDANIILFTEIILMSALLVMNAYDESLQSAAKMPLSSWFSPIFDSTHSYHTIEKVAWWGHIIGVFLFMNYLPFSKHWHIIMAFPNTYYANQNAKGSFENLDYVTQEVQLMMDPSAAVPDNYTPPTSFGVKDVKDLSRKNLMDAYSCTECGRCTSVCPQNITGKLLSPRKIMMDTRDRLEEVGKNTKKHDADYQDNKDLHSYISSEELWACNTCNACVEICPVEINPMDIIVKMRQYLVMEKSTAPAELNGMFSNMENNGAPWQFPASERGNWA